MEPVTGPIGLDMNAKIPNSTPSPRAILSIASLWIVLAIFSGLIAQDQTPFPPREKRHFGWIPDSERIVSKFPRFQSPPDTKLPVIFSLRKKLPPSGDQGSQNSSVAWSLGYSLMSYKNKVLHPEISYLRKDGSINRNAVYSPAFVFNQTQQKEGEGSTFLDTLRLLSYKGILPWNLMPYSASDYKQLPDESLLEISEKSKIQKYYRVDPDNIQDIRYAISRGIPVVVGLIVLPSFQELTADAIYEEPNGKDWQSGKEISLLLIGYNDKKKYFEVQNSWGSQWGEHGFGKISYSWIQKASLEAWVVQDKIQPQIKASQGNYSGKILVQWSRIQDAIGYNVYRKDPGSKKFRYVATTANTQIMDRSIFNGYAYQYRVEAILPNGKQTLAPTVSGFGGSGNLPPSPLPCENYVFEDGILSWNSVPDTKVYRVYGWSSDQQGFVRLTESRNPSISLAEIQFFPMYSVTSVNEGGSESEQSQVAVIQPKPEYPIPRDLHLLENVSEPTLAWASVKDAEEYLVLHFDTKDKKWKELGKTTLPQINIRNGKELEGQYLAVTAKTSSRTWTQYSDSFRLDLSSIALNAWIDVSGQLHVEWKENISDEFILEIRKPKEQKWKTFAKVEASEESFLTKIESTNSLFYLRQTWLNATGEPIKSSQSKILSNVQVLPSALPRDFVLEDISKKFIGPWIGFCWNERQGVQKVSVSIEHLQNSDFYKVVINNDKEFNPEFIQNSKTIEVSGKFKMQLSEDEEALRIFVKDDKILQTRTRVSLLRD